MFELLLDQNLQELTVQGTDAFPFEIYEGGLGNFEKGYLDWHWHDNFEVNYVARGSLSYYVENRVYRVRSGEAVFINSGRLHRAFTSDPEQRSFTIVFRPGLVCADRESPEYLSLVGGLVGSRTDGLHFVRTVSWMNDCLSILDRIRMVREQSSYGNAIEIKGLLCLLFSEILRNTPHSEILTSEEEEVRKRIRTILSFISQHYKEGLTLSDIAKEAGLSPEECSRFFHRHMGLPLFTYLNNYRIEKSCELLVHTDDPIGNIALATGYNSCSYFSKRFYENMNLTPKEYRRRIRNSVRKQTDVL